MYESGKDSLVSTTTLFHHFKKQNQLSLINILFIKELLIIVYYL